MSNYEHLFNPDFHKVGKGHEKLKKGDKVFKKFDRDKGKRLVRVNSTTWIYTDKATDEEAISDFNKRHGLEK